MSQPMPGKNEQSGHYTVSSSLAHAYDKIGIVISQPWKTTYYHALHYLDLVVAYP